MTTSTAFVCPVIAIDGPAAAGKGTLSKRLAAYLGYDMLDTGLLYRAVARRLLDQSSDPADVEAAHGIAKTLQTSDLERADLRGEVVGQAASICSGIPAVRECLLAFQQEFARHPPHGQGAILDGRDIGTAVCPEATVKLWVTASPQVRAQRRYDEAMTHGDTSLSVDEIAASIAQRDERERNRPISPLIPAQDAVVIDTSSLTMDDVFEQALNHVQAVLTMGTKSVHARTSRPGR